MNRMYIIAMVLAVCPLVYLFKLTAWHDLNLDADCMEVKVIYQEKEIREVEIKLYLLDLIGITCSAERFIFEKLQAELEGE